MIINLPTQVQERLKPDSLQAGTTPPPPHDRVTLGTCRHAAAGKLDQGGSALREGKTWGVTLCRLALSRSVNDSDNSSLSFGIQAWGSLRSGKTRGWAPAACLGPGAPWCALGSHMSHARTLYQERS